MPNHHDDLLTKCYPSLETVRRSKPHISSRNVKLQMSNSERSQRPPWGQTLDYLNRSSPDPTCGSRHSHARCPPDGRFTFDRRTSLRKRLYASSNVAQSLTP